MSVAAAAIPSARPTALLPWRQLGLISVYWFGINAIWGAYEGFGQKQVDLIVGRDSTGTVIGLMELLAAMVAIAVQPTIGAISDYTTSRFGKRKGYIITGTTFDLVFIIGFAIIAIPEPPPTVCNNAVCSFGWSGEALGSPSLLLVYTVLLLGLQFSSNFAQGPYQGYVPDLVAEPQVGVASGAIGVMRTIGQVFGFAVMAVGAALNQWGLAFLFVGIVEFVLAALTFMFVSDGPPGKPREGRSWLVIAREAWGTDILRERSFLLMFAVRLFFMMGTGAFVNLSLLYIERVFGMGGFERSAWQMGAVLMVVAGVVIAALPAARYSDRVGRKRVVWAAIAVAAVGTVIIAAAPEPPVALVGAFFFGAGGGMYLAVDWALMTDIIPLASSGRYMGIANIANSISGPLALVIVGPIMDAFTRAGQIETGPRVAVGIGVIALAVAAVLLVGVHPKRDPRQSEPLGPAGTAGLRVE